MQQSLPLTEGALKLIHQHIARVVLHAQYVERHVGMSDIHISERKNRFL